MMSKRPNRQERDAAAFQTFIKQYARKAPKSGDPNDRSYDRSLQRRARRMRPEELDTLLRNGEDKTSS